MTPDLIYLSITLTILERLVKYWLNDLTSVEGHQKRAKGEIIVIKGHVLAEGCEPIKEAKVEIWQACAWRF